MNLKLKKALALGLAFAFVNSAAVSAATIGTISGDDVNLRASNSTDSTVVLTLSSGAQLSVLEEANGWFKVASPTGGTAFVTSDYLKITQSDATVNADAVNVRTAPDTNSSVLGQLSQGDSLNVQGITGDWYIVLYNGTKAYVNKSFVTGNLLSYLPVTAQQPKEDTVVKDIYGIVNSASGLNLRADATTSSSIIKTLATGTTLDIIGVGDEWAKVKDSAGNVGFVSTAYLTLKNGEKPSATTASAKGEQMAAFAKQFIGTPYVYGGTNLNSGVDCSGFVYSIYKNFGITLNRSSRDQIKNGTAVNKSDLVAGDLVFFNTGGNTPISHVGMYIGNGQYIHSTDGGNKGVTITNLNSGYSAKTYYGACRVLK